MCQLTYWGRVTHICVSKLTIISSDNGLSPGRRQVIFWTKAGILLIGTLETNFSEILIECHSFSFKKIHMKMSSAKWRPFCLGLNELTTSQHWFRECFGNPVSEPMMDKFTYAYLLHDRPWISPWIKSISIELDIIIHVIASQLSRYCDVISNRLWRHRHDGSPSEWDTGMICKDSRFYNHLWIRFVV